MNSTLVSSHAFVLSHTHAECVVLTIHDRSHGVVVVVQLNSQIGKCEEKKSEWEKIKIERERERKVPPDTEMN